MNPQNSEIRCDGCGIVATDGHLAQRIERLELATRLRPIHIDTLILSPAPPARPEDYFYRPAQGSSVRGKEARAFFDALTRAAGVADAAGDTEEILLEKFQRAGWFLAGCSECPLEPSTGSDDEFANRFAPSVLRRVRFSYKPKHIILLSRHLQPWIVLFDEAGLADNLLLQHGQPVEIPAFADAAWWKQFEGNLAKLSPKAGLRTSSGPDA